MVGEIPALSVKKIKSLKAEVNAGARLVVPDGTVAGLGLRYGSSEKKVFILRGRVKGSQKTYRWTLGQFVENPIGENFVPLSETPFITLAEARQKAAAYLDCAKRGVDPEALMEKAKAEANESEREKERARQAEHIRQVKNSFGNVVEEFLKAKDPDGKGGHKVRPKTFYDYQRILRGNDFAEWRSRPIDSIKLNNCFLEPWVIHDLRRTAATGMAKLGVQPHIIEAALNHAVQGVAATYNRHPYEEEVRAALGQWVAHVASLLNPDLPSAKIIPLQGRVS